MKILTEKELIHIIQEEYYKILYEVKKKLDVKIKPTDISSDSEFFKVKHAESGLRYTIVKIVFGGDKTKPNSNRPIKGVIIRPFDSPDNSEFDVSIDSLKKEYVREIPQSEGN
jgi:hypothetical protein